MRWEDYATTGVGIAFGYALVPQVYSGLKNKVGAITKQTGIITTIGLAILIASEYSLGLRMAPVITSISCSLWAILTYQSFRYPSIEEKKKSLEQIATAEDLNDTGER